MLISSIDFFFHAKEMRKIQPRWLVPLCRALCEFNEYQIWIFNAIERLKSTGKIRSDEC